MASLSSNSRKRAACERCTRKRKKCVRPAGADECERCERNGTLCVERFRKKSGPKPGAVAGAAAGKAAGNKKRKREDETREGAATSDTRSMSFWDAMADGWILARLARHGPDHWGLQNMLYSLTARAYAKGSAALLSRAYALVNSMGVRLKDVTGPFANGIGHTLHATFEAFSDVPMRHHDRALGLAPQPWTPAPQPWTPGSLGERIVVIGTGVNSGSGHIGMSPAFRGLLGEDIIAKLPMHPTPALFVSETLGINMDRRGMHATIYLVEQYTSKDDGPISAKIPGIVTTSGVEYDEYITIWGEQLGHFYHIYELVPVSAAASSGEITSAAAASSGGITAVSIDEVPDEDLRAARSLTNLMG